MDDNPVQLLGWKSISEEDVEFFKCPECGVLTDFLFGNECFKCSKTIPDGEWLDAKEKAHVAVCASCDEHVDLTSRNRSMLGPPFYMCSPCNNILGVQFDSRILSPPEVLDFSFTPELQRRAQPLALSRYHVSEMNTDEERLILLFLLQLAKEEEGSFRFGEKEDDHALFCMDNSQYVGYVRWSLGDDGNEPVLRQIFIRKEWQRQGLGTMLLRHWAETIAFPVAEKFGVESPNEKSYGILVKLGYCADHPDNFKGIRCYQAPGM